MRKIHTLNTTDSSGIGALAVEKASTGTRGSSPFQQVEEAARGFASPGRLGQRLFTGTRNVARKLGEGGSCRGGKGADDEARPCRSFREDVRGDRPQSASYPISGDSIPDGLRHRETGEPLLKAMRGYVHDNGTSATLGALPHHRSELRSRAEPIGRRQHLRGKVCATLTATRGENAAAGASAHAQTETVGLGTPTVVRLEGPLAHVGTPHN